MWRCFENPFANDTSLDPKPLLSLHMRRRCSALSLRWTAGAATGPRGGGNLPYYETNGDVPLGRIFN